MVVVFCKGGGVISCEDFNLDQSFEWNCNYISRELETLRALERNSLWKIVFKLSAMYYT